MIKIDESVFEKMIVFFHCETNSEGVYVIYSNRLISKNHVSWGVWLKHRIKEIVVDGENWFVEEMESRQDD